MAIDLSGIALRLKVDDASVATTIEKALHEVEGDVVLDCTTLTRLNIDDIRALEALARAAHEKEAKVVVHGLKVELYKVLKLSKLATRFLFAEQSPN